MRRGWHRVRWPDDVVDRARALYAERRSYWAVAALLALEGHAVSENVVRDWCAYRTRQLPQIRPQKGALGGGRGVQ